MKCFSLLLLNTFICFTTTEAARPIVVIHGIFSDKQEMTPVVDHINKYLPNTYVRSITSTAIVSSTFESLEKQLRCLTQELQSDPYLKDGFNIVAHSQGGLLARAYIEQCNNPRVFNLITWGTPHRGIFGFPGAFDDSHPTVFDHIEKWASYLLYTSICQRLVSFSNYWHDSLREKAYLKHCRFLPKLNNEKRHKECPAYKKNITSLEHFVMVNSTAETIIEPDASCHFGYYKTGSKNILESFLTSKEYLYDRIGLKTLYNSGRLHFKTAHCYHTQYQEDELNFIENTLPFLI